MAQDLAIATALSSSLKGLLARIETEQPGAPMPASSRLKAEAQSALAAVDEALKPAPEALALRWLTALGTLTATRTDEADATGKARAYATMLEYPASAFTKSSLGVAARKFRWFPSFAELCEHLEAETAETKRLRHQLRRVMALPVQDDSPPPRYSDLPPDQRQRVDKILDDIRASLRSPAAGPPDDETTGGAT
jgi:hypothetical protein